MHSDTKPHAELPPLERTREYKDAATQWAEEFDWSDTDWEYVAEEQHANFICRTMQLLAALQSIAALTARAEKAERELYLSRVRMFTRYRSTSCNHTTACTIWGDDGQGGTAEGYAEPLPCNCGALLNYERTRAEAAEAEVASLRAAMGLLTNPSEGGDGYGNC